MYKLWIPRIFFLIMYANYKQLEELQSNILGINVHISLCIDKVNEWWHGGMISIALWI